jgi:hypothetical protein
LQRQPIFFTRSSQRAPLPLLLTAAVSFFPPGELFIWGSNTEGQCGHGIPPGSDSPPDSFPKPRLVKPLTARFVTRVACGSAHTLVLTGRCNVVSSRIAHFVHRTSDVHAMFCAVPRRHSASRYQRGVCIWPRRFRCARTWRHRRALNAATNHVSVQQWRCRNRCRWVIVHGLLSFTFNFIRQHHFANCTQATPSTSFATSAAIFHLLHLICDAIRRVPQCSLDFQRHCVHLGQGEIWPARTRSASHPQSAPVDNVKVLFDQLTCRYFLLPSTKSLHPGELAP